MQALHVYRKRSCKGTEACARWCSGECQNATRILSSAQSMMTMRQSVPRGISNAPSPAAPCTGNKAGQPRKIMTGAAGASVLRRWPCGVCQASGADEEERDECQQPPGHKRPALARTPQIARAAASRSRRHHLERHGITVYMCVVYVVGLRGVGVSKQEGKEEAVEAVAAFCAFRPPITRMTSPSHSLPPPPPPLPRLGPY